MTLTQRSKAAGNGDGSFSYGGFVVEPHVLNNDGAGVTVYTGRDEHEFVSWREAKEYIDNLRLMGRSDEGDE